MEEKKQAKLSKAVLEMKFMKKTKDRIEVEKDNAIGEAMYSKYVTEEMRKSGNIHFVRVGIRNCINMLEEGRLSFQGMNPEVEKLMVENYAKRMEETEKEQEKDISDLDMTKYSTLVGTMGKKFENKRQTPKKPKFLKPDDKDNLL